MAIFMSHEGFEPVPSFTSQDNGPQVSDNAKSAGQSMIVRRRRRRPSMPGGTKGRRGNEALEDKNPKATRSRGKKDAAARPKRVINYYQPRDSKGRFLPRKFNMTGTEEVNPYDSILNLQPPDFTTMLRILYGEYYAEQCRSITCLQDPDFNTLMNAMNDIGLKPVDDGPHDVLKVSMETDG